MEAGGLGITTNASIEGFHDMSLVKRVIEVDRALASTPDLENT